jgi:hypothetical protein
LRLRPKTAIDPAWPILFASCRRTIKTNTDHEFDAVVGWAKRPGANASVGVPTNSAKTFDSKNGGHGAKSAFAHPTDLHCGAMRQWCLKIQIKTS